MFGPRTLGGILEVEGPLILLLASQAGELLVTWNGQDIQVGITTGNAYAGLQTAGLQWLTTANFEALIPMLGETQSLLKFDTAQVLVTSTQQKLPKAVTTAEI